MFRTSSVHHQERFVQAVFADLVCGTTVRTTRHVQALQRLDVSISGYKVLLQSLWASLAYCVPVEHIRFYPTRSIILNSDQIWPKNPVPYTTKTYKYMKSFPVTGSIVDRKRTRRRKVANLTLYVPCIMFQCADKAKRCNTSYE